MNVLLHSLPPTHNSAGDSWTLPGKSGSVLCGVTAPFSWDLGIQDSLCAPPSPRVYFPGLYKFWQLYGGLMVTSSKRAYVISKSDATRDPVPVAVHCWPVPPQEMLKHSSISVSVGPLGSWCAQGLSVPSENPWKEWVLILNVNSPLLLSYWGFSFALGHVVSPHGCYSKAQPLLLTLDVGYLFKDAPVPHSCHGHGGEFSQNVVHWRRERQTTSEFLPWEPCE